MAIDISGEEEIVWCKPEAKKLPYVREIEIATSSRRRISLRNYRNRLVAYAVLKPDASSYARYFGLFYRRAWLLQKHDPYVNGDCPIEAVIPSSIITGKPSVSAYQERVL